MKLTEEQKQQFDWHGYLFFPSLFRPEEIKVLMDEVPALYAQRRPENICEKTANVVRTNFAAHMYSYPFALQDTREATGVHVRFTESRICEGTHFLCVAK